MASVYRICATLIKKEKAKAEPDFSSIIDKMDIYFGAGRLTDEEYQSLMDMING